MQFSMSDNPIDKLGCYLHNKKEDLSRVVWLMGKHKKIECRICGKVLDSWHDVYSPMQCGWVRITKYKWICHSCLDHRDFRPYIKQIDEDERVRWEKTNGNL